MKGFTKIPAFFATVTALLFFWSCTDVDDNLGLGFVPDDQQMVVGSATLTDVFDTYITRSDSIPTSFMGAVNIGSYKSDRFGTIKTGAVLQFMPYAFSGYGHNAVLDSAQLYLYVTGAFGNTDPDQKFNVYEITSDIDVDSTYYPSFPYSRVADLGEPLFTFDVPTTKAENVIARTLTPTTRGEAYLNKLMQLTEDVYDDIEGFKSEFKGFYIAPAADSPDDAAIYQVSLSDENGYYYSSLLLHTRSYEEDDPTEVADTLVHSFQFDDSIYDDADRNVSITTIEYDYTNSLINLALFADTTATSPTLSTIYVQGMYGVVSYLRFRQDILDQIEGLKNHSDGNTYSDIVLNKVNLIFPVVDGDVPEYLDIAPARLGMFHNYVTNLPVAIRDYPYWYEVQYATETYYGGYLDRNNGRYVMDISAYLHALLSGSTSEPRTIWLAPRWTAYPSVSEVVLSGKGNADPIRLEIVYTLIR